MNALITIMCVFVATINFFNAIQYIIMLVGVYDKLYNEPPTSKQKYKSRLDLLTLICN